MIHLILKRIAYRKKETLGIIIDSLTNLPICLILENPWLNNIPFKSCIPKGLYPIEPYSSAKYKNVFELKSVVGRDHILIHIGNTAKNTKGCLLPGSEFGELGGDFAVLSSGKAFKKLKSYLKNKKVQIEII